MKGTFIVFDGIDGSGKTALIGKLAEYFFSEKKQLNVLVTREPSSSEFGQQIRTMLKEQQDPQSHCGELLDLFIKDREVHTKELVVPFLKQENALVLCDRYYHSTLAFQQLQGVPVEKLIELNKGFVKPDLTFILDLPVDVALSRMKERSKEKFEDRVFMEKLRSAFLDLKNVCEDPLEIVDVTPSLDEVFETVRKRIEKLLD